jgi:hypothetical protein
MDTYEVEASAAFFVNKIIEKGGGHRSKRYFFLKTAFSNLQLNGE